ncbi:hypothetical protein GRJ2_002684600 [Grus japonensis]|uniref:Ig-like domain-containing protein n=1 Tax=Grus japonensis TaxID=30415 RepID=A0ABC9XWR2_GRUJA
MLGQVGCARLSPSRPAFLLLLLGASVNAQDICSFPGDGDSRDVDRKGGHLPAPHLNLNIRSAQPGDTVQAWCSIQKGSPASRIVFCKDGVEEYSLEAQQGQLNYFVLLNVTLGSAGMYRCGYQQRTESNWVRSSALSAPWHLTVRGTAMHLWVWILRSVLTLLLLISAPIITLILKRWSHCDSKDSQSGDIPDPFAL